MHINKFTLASMFATSLLLVSSYASAALLGVIPGYPQFVYGAGSTDLTGTLLDISSTPLELTFTAGDPEAHIIDTSTSNLTLQVDVDGLCAAIAGGAGTFSVTGDVYDPVSFALVLSGTLLTGNITAVGSAVATTTTTTFDFLATVTGGELVTSGDWPVDGALAPIDAAILLTVENSNFGSDCSTDFSGNAKGVIGPDGGGGGPQEIGDGTGTQGYWKNHPEAWPVETITVGGETYTKAEAIDLMETPVKGDKTYSMFRQLVAAMLNALAGNDDSCIAQDILDANQWLVDNPLGSGVKANSAAWASPGDALHEKLDDYNNGELCAPHRG